MKSSLCIALRTVLIFLLPLVLPAQAGPEDSLLYEDFKSRAEQEGYHGDLDTGMLYADSAIELAQKFFRADWEITALLIKATACLYNGKIRAVKPNLEAAKNFLNHHREDLKDVLLVLERRISNLEGMYQTAVGNLSRAKSIYDSLLTELKKYPLTSKADTSALVMCYFSLGHTYRLQRANEAALDHYREGIILQGSKGNNFYLAEIYQDMGEYEEALKNYEIAISARQKSLGKSTRKNNPQLITIHHDLAHLHLENDRPNLARKALEESLKYHAPEDPYLAATYSYLGEVYLADQQYLTARSAFERSLNYQKTNSELDRNHQYASNYYLLGDAFYQQSQWATALDYYQEALYHLADSLSKTDISQNPDLERIEFKMEALEVLRKKLQALRPLSKNPGTASRPGLNYSELSKATALICVDLIDEISREYSWESDKQFLLEQGYSIYELAIEIAVEQKDIELAFQLSERGRAMVLAEALEKRRAEILAQQPHLLEQKSLLRRTIMEYSLKIHNTNDSLEIARLRQEQFKAKQQLNKLREYIAQLPEIKKLLSREEILTSATIRNRLLEPNQALLEFFVGDRNVYAFYLPPGQDDIQLEVIPWTSELQTLARDINGEIFTEKDSAYTQHAYELYQQLLQPFFKKNGFPQRLVIIPDGLLGYLPYAALLTRAVPASEFRNFRNYPYLIDSVSISLGFSAATLLRDKESEIARAQKGILAMAPFSGKDPTGNFRRVGSDANPKSIHMQFAELLHSSKEVKKLNTEYRAKTFFNREAAKALFLELCGVYRILHLASHAKAYLDNPDTSFVAFADGFLTLGEVYSLNLRADMVVLSACETAVGKMVRGEGIISLARGFIYAGARSVVTTLWSVLDGPTNEVMQYFYAALEEGMSKDQALQKALVQYHTQEVGLERLHPNLWAAFTTIGNTESIALGRSSNKCLYFFGGLLLVLLLVAANRRRKKRA